MSPEAMPRIATVTLSLALDLTIRIPRLAAGEVNRVGPAELRPAGKGINVAAMLAVLGASDIAGFEAFLHPLGVATDFVPQAGRCRINVKLVETTAGQATDINPAGPEASIAMLEALAERLARYAPSQPRGAGRRPAAQPAARRLGHAAAPAGRARPSSCARQQRLGL